ncbi:MAG: hypothetical protein K0R67_1786 [Paenibacillus sp.]|nr:hypothetical protein [Paenibacillus sp.]
MKARALGSPIHTVSYVAAAYDSGDANRNPRIYAVSCGKIATLHIIDVFTGECLQLFELEGGSTHCWGIDLLPDGTVYMGSTQGYFYRLKPDAAELENLGLALESESFIWRIQADKQGIVYGGTYPNGKLFAYDPIRNSFRDYGQIVEGEKYLRSLALTTDTVFAGIGTQQAALVAIDKHSGNKTVITLPVDKIEGETVYDLNVVGDLVFVKLSPSNVMLIYNWVEQQWVDRLEGAMGWDISSPSPETGHIYFVQDYRLASYNMQTREVAQTSLECTQPARDFGWLRWQDQQAYPGWSLISVMQDGNYWLYNPQTDCGEIRETNVPGQENKIQCFAIDQHDRLLVGGFFAGGFAVYDHKADEITEYKSVGQPEGMIEYEGQVYLGVYPGARIYRYDPEKPWTIGSNPTLLFSLKDRDQDRPFAFVAAGQELAIGTVPFYGHHGGALTLYDPRTGRIDYHRHVIQNQSVVSLAYKDGVIYGGSSIHGGLGTSPVETSARIFAWDTVKREKIGDIIPVAESIAVYSLTFDEEGNLWGLTDTHIFKANPDGLVVVETIALNSFLPEQPKQWLGWHAGHLWFRPDGHLFGNIGGYLFRIATSTREATIMQEEVRLCIADRAGNIYFSRQTELFVLDV